jgi:hypothetical protein
VTAVFAEFDFLEPGLCLVSFHTVLLISVCPIVW